FSDRRSPTDLQTNRSRQFKHILSMKNHLLLALLITAVAAASCAKYLSREDDPAARYNEELLPFREVITEEFLHGHLSVIAHDSLQGRGTGMRGQKIAARYLSDFYRDLGFRPV